MIKRSKDHLVLPIDEKHKGLIEHSFVVRAPLERVWAFHNDVNALGSIMPGTMQVVDFDKPLRKGSAIRLRLTVGFISVTWILTVIAHEPMKRFIDKQTSGPFAAWQHEHAFEAVTDGTRVTDRVTYALPFGVAGRLVDRMIFRHALRASFAPRARATRRLLES